MGIRLSKVKQLTFFLWPQNCIGRLVEHLAAAPGPPIFPYDCRRRGTAMLGNLFFNTARETVSSATADMTRYQDVVLLLLMVSGEVLLCISFRGCTDRTTEGL